MKEYLKERSINAIDQIEFHLCPKDLTISLLLPLSSCASYSPGANSFANNIFCGNIAKFN